ncbi:MAG: hypothetical protein GY781_09440, partial [Gammaproteobacteria bacterium]|nr:hypothetical protein [Gammaproteobacteria bacterium]
MGYGSSTPGGTNEGFGGNDNNGRDNDHSGWDGGRNLTMNYPDIPGGFGYNPSAGAAGGMLHPAGMLAGLNYTPGS